MRSCLSPSIENYPYDVQLATLTLASCDYSTHKLNLTTDTWTSLILNRTDHNLKSWLTSPKALNIIHYKYFDRNTEWKFIGYKFSTGNLIDTVALRNFSTIQVELAFQRNDPYYTMTLILPIIMLTIMAPLGLILPQ